MDGKFVPNKTIQPTALAKILPRMDVQIHLMAYKPHKYISAFANLGAKEFIFHAEATKKAAETLEMTRDIGMKAGIAFNPETKIDKDLVKHADIALVMTVRPGFSGQQFMKRPLHKIAEIKKHNPAIVVGVDGGINTQTCRLAAHADATFAIATHSVTEATEPKKAYTELMKKCR